MQHEPLPDLDEVVREIEYLVERRAVLSSDLPQTVQDRFAHRVSARGGERQRTLVRPQKPFRRLAPESQCLAREVAADEAPEVARS